MRHFLYFIKASHTNMHKINYKIFYTNVLTYLVCSVMFCKEIQSARILAFFPTPAISHQVSFRPLTQELAKRGHEVTVITTDPVYPLGETPPNLFEIDVHKLSYKICKEKILDLYHNSMYQMMSFIYLILNEIFIEQTKSDAVGHILNNKNITFDLVLTEACVEATIVLGHIYKVPVIQVSSFGENYDNHDIIGSSTDALTYLQIFRKRIYNLSILEEIIEYYNYLIIMKNFDYVQMVLDKLLKEAFGPDIPPIKKLKNNVGMLYLNVHPLWDNRPVPSGVVYMGGIRTTHQKKEISKDLKQFLDSSVNGIVYVSFGSNVQLSTLPSEKVQIFLKVFAQLPHNVLLKCDLDTLEGISPNVKLSKWLPQTDVLRHHNVKGFVTQGGLQSAEEAISYAVPMIGIPFSVDQYLNTEQYVHYGIGIRQDLELITEESFKNAVLTITMNESYHANILKFRSWIRDQPQSPLSRAVWWTEHVLRHGGAQHLRAPAANMPWTEKLELSLVFDVIIGTVVSACLLLLIAYTLLKLLLCILYNHIYDKRFV